MIYIAEWRKARPPTPTLQRKIETIMSILAGLGAAAASFAMKEGHNAIAQSRNEKNMALEHDYWKRRVNQLEEMNRPSRQVAKWRSAGIAPQAVFGNSPGGAGIATDASSPNSQTPMGSGDFNFVTTIAERQRMKNEKAIADATVDKLNAEAANFVVIRKTRKLPKICNSLSLIGILIRNSASKCSLMLMKLTKNSGVLLMRLICKLSAVFILKPCRRSTN